MKKMTNTVVILTLINLAALLVMLFFCYHNWALNIPGICDECMVGVLFRLFVGFCAILIQVVVAVIMCICLYWFIKADGNIGLAVFCVVNLIFSVLQFRVFLGEIDVMIHSEPPTKADAFAIDMLSVQFNVARVMSVVLIALNVAILIATKLWYVKKRKLLLEYLNS